MSVISADEDETSLQNIHDFHDDVELETLGRVLQNVFERGFISNMEYRKAICTNLCDRRRRIYELTMRKNNNTALKIFSILKNPINAAFPYVGSSNEDSDEDEVVPNNPMMIETVIKSIFGFLNLADLKTCRYVCEKWNDVAEPIFRKLSKVIFGYGGNFSLSPQTFVDTFKYTLPNVPFTSFSFYGTFTNRELSTFFASYGKNITELEFNNIHLENKFSPNVSPDDDEDSWYSVDITSWISESKLKKLYIKGCRGKFLVPWNLLDSVQDLRIDQGGVYIPSLLDLAKITPTKIYLDEVDFFCDDKILETLNIDEIVDFSKATDISLQHNRCSTSLTIDVSISKVIAQSVCFSEITVLNWRLSEWDVEKFTLFYMVLENCPITYKQLCLRCIPVFDLSSLPNTVERIEVKEDCYVICTQPIHFPNLQVFNLTYNPGGHPPNDYSILSKFSTCANLVELSLTMFFADIDVNWLPKSVKKLKVKNSSFDILGDTFLHLQLLCLKYCDRDLQKIQKWIAKLKYEVLLIINNPMDFSEIDKHIVPFINQISEAKPIYVGTFDWDNDYEPLEFENTIFKNMVDKKSKAYVFTHKFGSSITEAEFKEINTFYKDTNKNYKNNCCTISNEFTN